MLNAIGNQETSALAWDWSVYHDVKFLPRVSYGNVVLSKARWTFSFPGKVSPEAFEAALKDMRSKRLPRYITVSEDDSALFFDLECEAMKNLLFDLAKKYGRLVLEESLIDVDTTLVSRSRQSFVSEFVFAIQSTRRKEEHFTIKPIPDFERNYHLGSEWLYLKVYCGMKNASEIMAQLGNLCNDLETTGAIKKWFFIKFFDSGYHIRVRLKGTNSIYRQVAPALIKLLKSLSSQRLVNDYSFNTYDREVEKYGVNTIDLCESMFHVDSIYSVKLSALLNYHFTNQQSWMVALKSVDTYLNDFGLPLRSKLALSRELAANYGKEFGLTDNTSNFKLINKKYYSNREAITTLLAPVSNSDVGSILSERSLRVQPIISSIKSASDNQVDFRELCIKLIHASMFRYFSIAPRFREMLIYNTLALHYQSILKKEESLPPERSVLKH